MSSLTEALPYLVNAALECRTSNDGEINLFITLRFGEDRFRSLFGTASITVARVHINLILEGCIAPNSSWSFDKAINLAVSAKSRVTKRQGTAATQKRRIKGRASPSPSIEAAKDAEEKEDEYLELRDEFNRIIMLIRARGSEKQPSWTLKSPPGEGFLEGTIFKDQLLCKLSPHDSDLKVDLRVEFPIDGLLFRTQNKDFRIPANKWSILQLLMRRNIRDRQHNVTSASFKNVRRQTVH